MPQRLFAHVDMDAFYASVEIRDDPRLAGRPVVVGGAPDHRGVVAAASYEARRYGIHSAMPMGRALRLCPHLVRLDPRFSAYRDESRQILELLGRFSPLIEPLSLDEAFLDLTGMEGVLGRPDAIGVAIKREIRARTRLTASVGIAPVKFVAKIASDLEKPDGLVIVPPEGARAFLDPLPIGRLWGVGPRTRELFESRGIVTIGDLARSETRTIERLLGEHGAGLIRLARGEDARGVVAETEAKSYSHEETFARDTADRERLESVLLSQAIRVSRRLRLDGLAGRTVQLKLRDAGFHTITRRRTLSEATADDERIFDAVRSLLRRHWDGAPVRLIGCGVSQVEHQADTPANLFIAPELDGRRRRLADAVDRLSDRFGEETVTRARLCRTPRGELISEAVEPGGGWLSVDGMGRGEPGVPEQLTWRGRQTQVAECVRTWRKFGPEPTGELYLRRHYFELRMSDGGTWIVYCLRQAGRAGAAARRWYLERVIAPE